MKKISDYQKEFSEELRELEERLSQIEKRLEELPPETVLIKKIKGKPYYYRQFREEGKTKSKSLGAVKPGSAAVEERHDLRPRAGVVRAERCVGGAGGYPLLDRPKNRVVVRIATSNVGEGVARALRFRAAGGSPYRIRDAAR